MYGNTLSRSVVSGPLALAFLASLIAASVLSGQSPPASSPEDVARDRERAAELAREADRLAVDMEKWSKAARLYEESALLHPVGDLEGYASFVNAGNFHYYAGHRGSARRMFEAAGRLALEHGEVYNAAVCFLNAAVIAKENGEKEKVAENGLKAQKLARSSVLTAEQRTTLLHRFATTKSAAS